MIPTLLGLLLVLSSDLTSSLSPWRDVFNQYQSTVEASNSAAQFQGVKQMLAAQMPLLRPEVASKVLTSLKCASNYNIGQKHILTLIDYSLPSNEKRLWVFDLAEKKLLFHTYVSHGIKSGGLNTNSFSNKYNSKASSLGIYQTEQAYYGREGLSLKLEGLDRSFNDNAYNRSIVMHGGWYVEEPFIKKYGRPGRSWGCPAVPIAHYQPIINTIKDKSLMVVYYPDERWLTGSKFLHCGQQVGSQRAILSQAYPGKDEQREEIVFASVIKGGEEPIVATTADEYQRMYHRPVPLDRMLRRQINQVEYVAISNAELNQLASTNNQNGLKAIFFIIPTLHMVHGYYETQLKIIDMGTIKAIHPQNNPLDTRHYTVTFETKPTVNLKATDRFVRWVGL